MLSPDTKVKIQNFGRFLSNMVMPNIGAFIAWGFITALFIPTGWLPNETLAKLVGPMITYLLPLLRRADSAALAHWGSDADEPAPRRSGTPSGLPRGAARRKCGSSTATRSHRSASTTN